MPTREIVQRIVSFHALCSSASRQVVLEQGLGATCNGLAATSSGGFAIANFVVFIRISSHCFAGTAALRKVRHRRLQAPLDEIGGAENPELSCALNIEDIRRRRGADHGDGD